MYLFATKNRFGCSGAIFVCIVDACGFMILYVCGDKRVVAPVLCILFQVLDFDFSWVVGFASVLCTVALLIAVTSVDAS